jgi:hypothetical protein
MSNGMVYRHKNIYMKRCDKCTKLSHYTYRIQLGQHNYTFCSGMCADTARKEYEYKEKNGISPNNSEPINDEGGDLSE